MRGANVRAVRRAFLRIISVVPHAFLVMASYLLGMCLMIEVKEQTRGYRRDAALTLRGTSPMGAGQCITIRPGETITCGRSRHCEWSLKKTSTYLDGDRETRAALRKNVSFASVSRKHVKITFLARDMVELENLSTNGTFVNGHRIDRVVLYDCFERAHTIQLGKRDVTLRLEERLSEERLSEERLSEERKPTERPREAEARDLESQTSPSESSLD